MGKAMYHLPTEDDEQVRHYLCSHGAYSLMVKTMTQTPVIKWDTFCDERHGDCHKTKGQSKESVCKEVRRSFLEEMKLCEDLKNKSPVTRKRRTQGGKQFSRQKSELVQKVRSRGKGTRFWKGWARSSRAFVRDGKPMNDFKWKNEMVKCAEGNRTQARTSLCTSVVVRERDEDACAKAVAKDSREVGRAKKHKAESAGLG